MQLKKGDFGIFPAQLCKGLHPFQQILLTWLWFHKNHEDVCWPSIKILSEETGMSRDSVIRHLNELEKSGRIKKVKRWNEEEQRNNSNMYAITLSAEGVVAESDSNHTQLEPNPKKNTNGQMMKIAIVMRNNGVFKQKTTAILL